MSTKTAITNGIHHKSNAPLTSNQSTQQNSNTKPAEAIKDQIQQLIVYSDAPRVQDSDNLEQFLPLLKAACLEDQPDEILDQLSQFESERDDEIQKLCGENHLEFVQSVDQLLKVRNGTVELKSQISNLNEDIQKSGAQLVDKKKALIETKNTRQNIEEATDTIRKCLMILSMSKRVHDLIDQKKHYGALRTLDDLQTIGLKDVMHYEFAKLIKVSTAATQKMVQDAVMADLKGWLLRIRESSRLIGQVAFEKTDIRQNSWTSYISRRPQLRHARLNSAIEMALEEQDDYDILDNERVSINFTPLYEAIHIHRELGLEEELKRNFENDRRAQKDLLLPKTFVLEDGDVSKLEEMLEQIAGFAIIERQTMRLAKGFRSVNEVDELWESMGRRVVDCLSFVLHDVNDLEILLRVKTCIVLLIQTVEVYDYSIELLHSFTMSLFEKYMDVLKRQFQETFQKSVTEDSFTPMVINDRRALEKVIETAWYKPENPRFIKFPYTLPFSQIYPLSCFQLRDYVDHFWIFCDEYLKYQSDCDRILKKSLDELLTREIKTALTQRLGSRNLGQIVQIIVNLEQFAHAAVKLNENIDQITAVPRAKLKAAGEFVDARKIAEKRVFELINSKIDDFLDLAGYDWTPNGRQNVESNYLVEMVKYLTDIITSTLLNLPESIKKFIYFDAFDHLASSLLNMLLDPTLKKINDDGILNFDMDVRYLENFVAELNDASVSGADSMLQLRQSVDLLKSNNLDEYLDGNIRQKKYSRLKKETAIILIEKLLNTQPSFSMSHSARERTKNLENLLGVLKARPIQNG